MSKLGTVLTSLRRRGCSWLAPECFCMPHTSNIRSIFNLVLVFRRNALIRWGNKIQATIMVMIIIIIIIICDERAQ